MGIDFKSIFKKLLFASMTFVPLLCLAGIGLLFDSQGLQLGETDDYSSLLVDCEDPSSIMNTRQRDEVSTWASAQLL